MDSTFKPFGLGVRAVIRDGHGRCLLVRRAPGSRHEPGRWEWPGGKCDAGEAVDKALQREVLEETGLAIRLTRFGGAMETELAHVRPIMMVFDAQVSGGRVRLSDEHDAHAWVGQDELNAFDLTGATRRVCREPCGAVGLF